MLDQLAGFLVELHRTGVYHRDLHIGNILYRCDARGNCRFQLIDTNRMTFHRRLSQRRRIENLRRLACETDAYLYILKRYAEATGADTHSFQLRGVAASVSRGMAPPAAQNQKGISRDPPGRKDGFRHSGKIEILPSGGAAAAGTRHSARMTLYR